ncbi:MAG: hypothetical protein ACOCNL_13355, partial [Acetivibrio ethanolgignens]
MNERVKEVVRTDILDADYTELGEQSKAVQFWLQNDSKYFQLKKALEDYRLKAFAESPDYQKISRATLFTAFVAVSKLVKGINIPENYLTEDNGKTLERLASENICDTDSRIASLICRVNDTFKPTKVTRSV